MKKLFSLLLPLLALISVASCSDDKDLPDVDFGFQFENAVRGDDGKLYVVAGDTLKITSITVTNREEGKAAIITSAGFYWDGYPVGVSLVPPFPFNLYIVPQTPAGQHSLDVQCPVAAVDKELATAVVGFRVEVVESETDMPDAGEAAFSVKASLNQ